MTGIFRAPWTLSSGKVDRPITYNYLGNLLQYRDGLLSAWDGSRLVGAVRALSATFMICLLLLNTKGVA